MIALFRVCVLTSSILCISWCVYMCWEKSKCLYEWVQEWALNVCVYESAIKVCALLTLVVHLSPGMGWMLSDWMPLHRSAETLMPSVPTNCCTGNSTILKARGRKSLYNHTNNLLSLNTDLECSEPHEPVQSVVIWRYQTWASSHITWK